MSTTSLNVFIPIILIAVIMVVLSLLFAVVRIFRGSPNMLNKFWKLAVNSQVNFGVGKYSRIGIFFIYYFLTTPLKKIREIDNELYFVSIIARTMSAIAVILILFYTVFIYI